MGVLVYMSCSLYTTDKSCTNYNMSQVFLAGTYSIIAVYLNNILPVLGKRNVFSDRGLTWCAAM